MPALAYFLEHLPDNLQKSGLTISRKHRMLLMILGCASIALGIIIPWFVIMFLPSGGGLLADGVTYQRQLVFVNALNLNSASIGNGWLTLRVGNGAILVGLHACEVAGVVTAAVWVTSRMQETQLFARIPLLTKLIIAIVLRFINAGAIATFIVAMWTATHFFDYQDTIRAGAYAAFGGGSAGQTVADTLFVFPFFGLFFLLLGLAMSVLGLYTVDATDEQIEKRQRWLDRSKRLVGVVVSIAFFGALVLGIYAALEYFGGH